MANEVEGGGLDPMAQRLAILEAASLIEMQARVLREQLCHAQALRNSAAQMGLELAPPGALAALNGGVNGNVRIPPTQKQVRVMEAEQAEGNARAAAINVVNLAAKLQQVMAG